MMDTEALQRLERVRYYPTRQEREWIKSRPAMFGFASKDQYATSQHWKNMREYLFYKRGGLCEVCQLNKAKCVHHITYRNLCDEREEDLATLCNTCHSRAHYNSFSECFPEEVSDLLLELSDELGYTRAGRYELVLAVLEYATLHPDLFRKR